MAIKTRQYSQQRYKCLYAQNILKHIKWHKKECVNNTVRMYKLPVGKI